MQTLTIILAIAALAVSLHAIAVSRAAIRLLRKSARGQDPGPGATVRIHNDEAPAP